MQKSPKRHTLAIQDLTRKRTRIKIGIIENKKKITQYIVDSVININTSLPNKNTTPLNWSYKIKTIKGI